MMRKNEIWPYQYIHITYDSSKAHRKLLVDINWAIWVRRQPRDRFDHVALDLGPVLEIEELFVHVVSWCFSFVLSSCNGIGMCTNDAEPLMWNLGLRTYHITYFLRRCIYFDLCCDRHVDRLHWEITFEYNLSML